MRNPQIVNGIMDKMIENHMEYSVSENDSLLGCV